MIDSTMCVCVCVCGVCTVVVYSLSHVQLFVNPWTIAYQAPLSVWFLMPEYWSGLLFLTPGDLPNPGSETASPANLLNCR